MERLVPCVPTCPGHFVRSLDNLCPSAGPVPVSSPHFLRLFLLASLLHSGACSMGARRSQVSWRRRWRDRTRWSACGLSSLGAITPRTPGRAICLALRLEEEP
jgi:hypothetical protein